VLSYDTNFLIRLHRMHEILTILTNVLGVSLSVCLSVYQNSLNQRRHLQYTPRTVCAVIQCSLCKITLTTCCCCCCCHLSVSVESMYSCFISFIECCCVLLARTFTAGTRFRLRGSAEWTWRSQWCLRSITISNLRAAARGLSRWMMKQLFALITMADVIFLYSYAYSYQQIFRWTRTCWSAFFCRFFVSLY